MLATPRRAIPYPNPDRSDRPDIPLHIYNVAIAADGDVIYNQGTNASRGSAIHETSGGRLWWETDTSLLWYDDGTSWFSVGVNPTGSLTFTGTTSQLAFTGENATGNTVIRSRLSGDAFDRITVGADGKISWGSGAAGVDTNLYRSAANALKTDDALTITGILTAECANFAIEASALGSVTSTGIYFKVAGDASSRYSVLGDGTLQWGSGAGAYDTNLYRSAADTLKTDDTFTSSGISYLSAAGVYTFRPAASSSFRNFLLSTDAQPAFQIDGNGQLHWGAGGASAVDTNLYRGSANLLITDDTMEAVLGFIVPRYDAGAAFGGVQTATHVLIQNYLLSSDTNPAFRAYGDGKLVWGAGGASAVDTQLIRSAANQLSLGLGTGGKLSLGSLQVDVNDTSAKITFGSAEDVAVNRAASGRIEVLTGAAFGDFDAAQIRSYDGISLMNTHRHPFSNYRHIESGAQINGSITFANAFAVTPHAALGDTAGNGKTNISALSTTGMTFSSSTWSSYTIAGHWIAEGQD